jgi:hypothetical protein
LSCSRSQRLFRTQNTHRWLGLGRGALPKPAGVHNSRLQYFVRNKIITYRVFGFSKHTVHEQSTSVGLLCSSERGAAEGAEPELRVNGAAAHAAPLAPGHERRRRPRLGAEGPRREEAALAAEVGGVLPRPPPDGDEEQLEHLLRLHQVRRAAAPQAPRRRLLEHLPRALLHAAHEEEEHLASRTLSAYGPSQRSVFR